MAKCPKCGREWKWDFDDNNLHSGRKTIARTEGDYEDPEGVTYFCRCGLKLGRMTEEDGMIEEPEEWKGIDWDAEENCC